MQVLKLLVWLACLAILAPSVEAAGKTQARLMLAAEQARAGDTILVGVELRMAPKWHTYWRNAGESGMPTKIDWQLPAGVTAGEVQWPAPEKLTVAGLTTYIYYDSVVLLVPLTLAANLAQGPMELKAKVSWLECEDVCLPGDGEVRATLTVGTETKPAKDSTLIQSWQKRLPQTAPFPVTARWEKPAAEDSRPLLIEWDSTVVPILSAGGEVTSSTSSQSQKLLTSSPADKTRNQAQPGTAEESKTARLEADFFPSGGSDDYEVAGATERLPAQASKQVLRKAVKKFGEQWPSEIPGLIVMKTAPDSAPAAYQVTLRIAGLAAAKSDASPMFPPVGRPNEVASTSLWAMLGLAFLGGLILNIMPCVLPVIALKIFGFVSQSRENPRRVRQLGAIYALGVLVSFLVLAGLVIAVQQAGRTASWGMQFQNPQFLVGMTVLVTLVALNLFGLFEINLSGGAMTAAGSLSAQEGGAGAFFNGVLATALATPCTAPFLGVALGYAFAQPPAVIVLMFATIGLGLAAPYLVLSWHPGWLKFLPKPGAWMQRFKIAVGFPMLATAVWLLSQTASHFGRRGPLWIGLFLVALAMAAWVWGEFVQRGRKRTGLAMAASLGLVAVAYGLVLERELNWRAPVVLAKSSDALPGHADGISWQPWTAKAVEEARAAGRPVLVDFTADWCLTCQANKITSLEIPAVRARLKELNAAAFLGDYTTADPAIATELKRFGRAGVPLVLVYSPDFNSPTNVLPEVLTPGIVLEALSRASEPRLATRQEASPGQ